MAAGIESEASNRAPAKANLADPNPGASCTGSLPRYEGKGQTL